MAPKTNLKLFLILLLFLIFLLSSSVSILAKSSYTLPYPSSMPGSRFYKIQQIAEKISYYWYFGNFGKFNYHLKISDKYLVEAKTLFEYEQYLLAYNALQESNRNFGQIFMYLDSARAEGKDTSDKNEKLKEASKKHIEELRKLIKILPPSFVWKPEKGKPVNLNIQELIKTSIDIREQSL